MQHLYISYPESDPDFAYRLVDDLQAANYPVFVDAVSNLGTMAWARETRHAIRSCGALLMVLALEDGRRVGIRHEGVLARRRQKPVFVLLRSPGELPRYLAGATVIDFSGDYHAAFEQLVAELPSAMSLLAAESAAPRGPRRPPRQVERHKRQVRTWLMVGLVIIGVLLVVLGGVTFF